MNNKKPKLTTEQNLTLRGMNLQQRLEQLHKWYIEGKISKETFEALSNALINKASRKAQNPLGASGSLEDNLPRDCPRSVVEGEIQAFLERLRGNIRSYITNRNPNVASLTKREIEKFKRYTINYCIVYPAKVSRLLIIGLRYPDKQLNEFCVNWIRGDSLSFGKNYYYDHHFWGLLWEDGDLVPLDAIRLMGQKEGEEFIIDSRFEKTFIKTLMPYFEAQRDKEVMRLKLAMMRDDRDDERQVARKLKRLNAFNILIAAAEKYCAAEAEFAAE